jgi:phosphatidate phosphatase APP1
VTDPPPTDPPPALHRAARVEDRVHAGVERWLRRRGWRPRVLAYRGYGGDGWVRVLARVLLAPPDTGSADLRLGRGFRRFLTATAADVEVTVLVGIRTHRVVSARGGYVDAVLQSDLGPGWSEVTMQVEGGAPVPVAVRVVGGDTTVGVVSDIDDTVLVTALPRPLLAAWNTFVRHEGTRRPVRGMATLYREIEAQHPEAPYFYLSTGAWNVAPVLDQFLHRHAYPPGPLLMTDWGPTPDAWFRSGQEHKRREIARLLGDFPGIRWLLIGDDGQHDPEIYREVAERRPERVRAVVIRQLSPTEQVLTHGTPEPIRQPRRGGRHSRRTYDDVRAPDGFRLLSRLRERGLLG